MANRYWTRGASTTVWNATSPKTNWGTASNTQDNASVPTDLDDVIFDGVGTGASNCSVPVATISAKTITCTGYSNIISGASVSLYGNVTLSSGMTFSSNLNFRHSSGTAYLSSCGISIDSDIGVYSEGSGKLTLSDKLSTAGKIQLTGGKFDSGNFDVQAYYFHVSSGFTEVNLGSSTITITGTTSSTTYAWSCNSGLTTMNAGTSTIRLIAGMCRYFFGGGKTYYNLKFSAWSGASRIYDSNTFNNIEQEVDSSSSPVIYLEHGKTQTVTSLTITGYSSSKRITLRSNLASAHIISCASGTISVDHIDISYSTASGGASFVGGSDSIDSGNNTGWDLPSILSYSGSVTLGITPGSSYADYDSYLYFGSIPLAIIPSSSSHRNTEWNGSVTIGITPSHSRVRIIKRTGNLGVVFVPSSVKAITLNRSGRLPISIGVTSAVQKVNSTYHAYTGVLSSYFTVGSTIKIRKKLKVKDPVVTGGCPQCGCLIYNR